MALSSSPHRSQILSEFGTFTETANVNNGSLSDAYNYVFDETSGHTRESFANLGQPSVGTFSAANTSGRTIRLTIPLTVNGLLTTVRVRSSTDDFVGVDNFETSSSFSNSGTPTIDLNMPDYSTTYYFRVEVYNKFNSDSND